MVFSQGVVGAGRAFYQQVLARQLEGVVAKRLDSLYRPGRRDGAWIKIKPLPIDLSRSAESNSRTHFGGCPRKDR